MKAICFLLIFLTAWLPGSSLPPDPAPSAPQSESLLSLLSVSQRKELRFLLLADGVRLPTNVEDLEAAALPSGTWNLISWYSFRPDQGEYPPTDKLCAIRCQEPDYFLDLILSRQGAETLQPELTRYAHPLTNHIKGDIIYATPQFAAV